MITIGANGKRIAYGIKHYNLDTEADLAEMPRSNEYMGSTCFVISTSKYYMLNSSLEWVEISPFGKGTGAAGGNGGADPEDKDIIYDGGVL